MTATLTKWYEEHGRHEIFAGGKNVKMESSAHSLLLKDELVTNEEQHDLDKLGIAKNSGEEKKRARDAQASAGLAERSRSAERRCGLQCAHGCSLSRSRVAGEAGGLGERVYSAGGFDWVQA